MSDGPTSIGLFCVAATFGKLSAETGNFVMARVSAGMCGALVCLAVLHLLAILIEPTYGGDDDGFGDDYS